MHKAMLEILTALLFVTSQIVFVDKFHYELYTTALI